LDDIIDHNAKYEKDVGSNESYALELLNNIDQIIYRGEIKRELKEYGKRNNNCIDTAVSFYSNMNYYGLVLNIILFIILIGCISYIIQMNFNKEINIPLFITLFSILLLYRDKMQTIIQQYPDFIEFIGRMNSVLKIFEYMDIDNNNNNGDNNDNENNTQSIILPFQKIRFENVTFRYKKEDAPIFEKKSLEIVIDNKIIGIMGPSGCGKSTLMKLILKLYKMEEGKIYIDDVVIDNIDSEYIRKHISYVNQNSKLFDKKVMENIYYGCPDYKACRRHYDEIMKYDKIRDLFSDVNLETKESGSGGSNLSGGQRQIINIVNGLIRPCEILILDEPTNALDGQLKRELLNLIRDFKKYKKGIIIITHDNDIRPLFDQVITI
jgi:ABC-type bacteriocin/lantibiotic exporter with double-glycine peptidase domain